MPAFNATITISVPYPARSKYAAVSAAHDKAAAILKAAMNGAMSATQEGDELVIEATELREGQPVKVKASKPASQPTSDAA